jgi:hypothetical protein
LSHSTSFIFIFIWNFFCSAWFWTQSLHTHWATTGSMNELHPNP